MFYNFYIIFSLQFSVVDSDFYIFFISNCHKLFCIDRAVLPKKQHQHGPCLHGSQTKPRYSMWVLSI